MEIEDADIKVDFIGKYAYVPKTDKWPEWNRFVIGVGHGYHMFSEEKDFNEFLKIYREKHKNDYDDYVERTKYLFEETQKAGKIGF